MGLLDIIFGKGQPKPAKRDALFEILSAQVTLATRHNILPQGRAGLCLRPVSSSFFQTLDRDVRDLLKISAGETHTEVRVADDPYGYRWVVLEDPHFEDIVTTIHMTSDMVADHGFADRLLAAAFRFRSEERDMYWVYNYRRGAFYPFIPIAGKKDRDNQQELRMAAIMEQEMTIEKQLDQWYALWDLPV